MGAEIQTQIFCGGSLSPWLLNHPITPGLVKLFLDKRRTSEQKVKAHLNFGFKQWKTDFFLLLFFDVAVYWRNTVEGRLATVLSVTKYSAKICFQEISWPKQMNRSPKNDSNHVLIAIDLSSNNLHRSNGPHTTLELFGQNWLLTVLCHCCAFTRLSQVVLLRFSLLWLIRQPEEL